MLKPIQNCYFTKFPGFFFLFFQIQIFEYPLNTKRQPCIYLLFFKNIHLFKLLDVLVLNSATVNDPDYAPYTPSWGRRRRRGVGDGVLAFVTPPGSWIERERLSYRRRRSAIEFLRPERSRGSTRSSSSDGRRCGVADGRGFSGDDGGDRGASSSTTWFPLLHLVTGTAAVAAGAGDAGALGTANTLSKSELFASFGSPPPPLLNALSFGGVNGFGPRRGWEKKLTSAQVDHGL